MAYHKAPSVFHLLRTYIGDELFFNSLQRFYTQFQYQIASFSDLIECFNYYTDITWFLPWFNEGFIPEVEIISAQAIETATNDYNLSITLKQIGTSVYPTKIPFTISFDEIDSNLVWFWCNTSTARTLEITVKDKPISLVSDLTSGYLYSLNLLEMAPYPIQIYVTGTTDTTSTTDDISIPWLALSPVLGYLLILTIILKKRKK
jgi:aminopeptidase N